MRAPAGRAPTSNPRSERRGRRFALALRMALAALVVGGASGAHAQTAAPVPLFQPSPAPSAAAGVGRWSAEQMRQLAPQAEAAPPVPVPDAPSAPPVLTPAQETEAAPPRPLPRAQAAPRPLVAPLAPPRMPAALINGGLRAGEVEVPINKSQVLQVDQTFDEVSVGNAEVADVVPLTRRSIYVFGKQLGSTNLTLIGTGGNVIAVVDLVVTFDIAGLKGRLFELVPDARVEIRPAGDAIVLSGEVPSADKLAQVLAVAERFAPERVTNLLSVTGSQQVLLQVRFAEVERATVKLLGLSSLFVEFGSTSFQLDTGDGVSADPQSFATGILSLLKGDYSLDVIFDVLEEKGVVKTLAEPNLIALSGDTASFLAGGEFPIPVGQDSDDEGVDITIEFKEFGVGLSFTPTVIGQDLINLVLFTEVSEIDPTVSIVVDNLVIPGLQVRRAKTTVELRDGQAFAIAGLLQDDFEDSVRQFPLLGDLPILGTLFRSTQFQRNLTELVVIITPRLVQPVVPTALATPLDRFMPPSEFELFFLGRTEGALPPPATEEDPAGALARRAAGGIVGPYGYILE